MLSQSVGAVCGRVRHRHVVRSMLRRLRATSLRAYTCVFSPCAFFHHPRLLAVCIAARPAMASSAGPALTQADRTLPLEETDADGTVTVRAPKAIWKSSGLRSAFAAPGASAAAASHATAAVAAPAEDIVPPVPLDEAQFEQIVTVVALRVPAKKCGVLQPLLRGLQPGPLLDRPRISPIVDGPTKDSKYILLSLSSLKELESLPEATRERIAAEGATPVLYTFTLGYEYFTQEHVLRKLLPPGMPIPAGFETVGHIAHLNLADEQRPYGKLIARVILDVRVKQRMCETLALQGCRLFFSALAVFRKILISTQW